VRALPLVAAALALASVWTTARAQAPAPRPESPPAPRFTVATNPIAPVFGAYSAELEAPAGRRGVTVGVGGTYDTDRDNMSWVEGKALYYFGGRPLSGLSAGLTAGLASTRGPVGPSCGGVPPQGCEQGTETAALAGALAGYNWLLGRRRQVLIGTGVGVQRIFAGNETSRMPGVVADGRLVVGWAF
jgi:hypothetical protein